MKYIKHTLALSLLVLLSACRTAQPPPSPSLPGAFSGIPKTLSDDSWFPSDAGYHLPPHHDPNDSYGPTFDGGETTQRRMVVTFTSGNRGDLVTKCRGGVMKLLAGVGADVRGGNTFGDRNGLRDFSENYKWHDNVGMIRIYSSVTGKQEVTLIVFCNEHKR
jgi:hypothetical protein